jgi:hypothetical protein
MEAPFNLPWGSSIYATVSSTNTYGVSIDSTPGNGAVILTVPDRPINLSNVVSQTLATQIGLSWEDGFSDGGTPVINYLLTFD